jgi:hypothetical protein
VFHRHCFSARLERIDAVEDMIDSHVARTLAASPMAGKEAVRFQLFSRYCGGAPNRLRVGTSANEPAPNRTRACQDFADGAKGFSEASSSLEKGGSEPARRALIWWLERGMVDRRW